MAASPTLAPLWTLIDPPPVSAPVAVDGLILYYTSRDGALYLVAVDPATGAVRWEHEASPGDGPAGIELQVIASAEFVFFLRPLDTESFLSSLIVMRPSSGEEVFASDPWYVQQLNLCEEDSPLACLSRVEKNGRTRDALVLDPATGALTPDENLPSGRAIGDGGVFDPGTREPEFIGRAVDGSVLWLQPVTELFGEGFSTDYGWWWEHWPSHQTIAGSVGNVIGLEEQVPMDLASATVGVDEATGALRWRDTGTRLFCFMFDVEDESSGESVPYRCRYNEGTVVTNEDDLEQVFHSPDMVIEGFDVTSGQTTWSVPLALPEQLTYNDFFDLLRRTAGPEFTVPTADGQQVIDPRTGALRPIAPSDVFWCESYGTYEYRVPFEAGPEDTFERVAGLRVNACGVGGEPVAPQGPLPARYTAVVDGVAVIATPDGLVAYPAA